MMCSGFLGLLLGHKFRPRYSYGQPALTSFKAEYRLDLEAIVQASKPATYCHDVCERCGITRKGNA